MLLLSCRQTQSPTPDNRRRCTRSTAGFRCPTRAEAWPCWRLQTQSVRTGRGSLALHDPAAGRWRGHQFTGAGAVLQWQSTSAGHWASLVHAPAHVCGAPQVPLDSASRLVTKTVLENRTGAGIATRLFARSAVAVVVPHRRRRSCPVRLCLAQAIWTARQSPSLWQAPRQVSGAPQMPEGFFCSRLQAQCTAVGHWVSFEHDPLQATGVSHRPVNVLQTQPGRFGHWGIVGSQRPPQIRMGWQGSSCRGLTGQSAQGGKGRGCWDRCCRRCSRTGGRRGRSPRRRECGSVYRPGPADSGRPHLFAPAGTSFVFPLPFFFSLLASTLLRPPSGARPEAASPASSRVKPLRLSEAASSRVSSSKRRSSTIPANPWTGGEA